MEAEGDYYTKTQYRDGCFRKACLELGKHAPNCIYESDLISTQRTITRHSSGGFGGVVFGGGGREDGQGFGGGGRIRCCLIGLDKIFPILCGRADCENAEEHQAPCQGVDDPKYCGIPACVAMGFHVEPCYGIWINHESLTVDILHPVCESGNCCDCCKCPPCNDEKHDDNCKCEGTHCLYKPSDLRFIVDLFEILFRYLDSILTWMEELTEIKSILETLTELSFSQMYLLQDILNEIRGFRTDQRPVTDLLQELIDAIKALRINITNNYDMQERMPWWERIINIILDILEWIIGLLMDLIEFLLSFFNTLYEMTIAPIFGWLMRTATEFLSLFAWDSPLNRWNREGEALFDVTASIPSRRYTEWSIAA